MMTYLSMISNLIIAVKIHKHTRGDSESCYVVVEYSSSDDAQEAIAKEIEFAGIHLDKDFAKSGKDKAAKKPPVNYKTKIYLGNLTDEFTDEDLHQALDGKVMPKTKFVSAKGLAVGQKKYAFLEFETEAERNIALGTLETIKQDGSLGDEVIISPAYPYAQGRKVTKRRMLPSK
ncbi:hypothetical protein NEHOM01_2340 [Nematocida homosporus]|uniref:uncharacterized protein n=1 Tax=Nematocida homosporus TaxID=1912981 RepID=UPI00221E6765|nr:uncharacterized protein NEHOM01_2340 [Nematocida homosporus]KAI5187749.1 hypothetical protein NEHOM01_2340 [Nematocida homosporus]